MEANASVASADALARVAGEASASRRRDAVVAGGTGALVLLASFVNFLQYNEYPLLRQEVGIVAGLLLLLAALVGLLYAAADRPGRIALQILLVSLSFDLNFDGLASVIGIAATVILLNRYMMPFIGIVAAVVLASGVAASAFDTSGSGESSMPAAKLSDAPPLLHLILDEHIGVEGLLGDASAPTAMRQGLRDFYVDKGFRLFGGAYSEYFHTVNSIPQVLNFGTQQQWPEAGPIGMVISNNAYFDRLREIGYRIAVYQTDFMKFCVVDQSENCRQHRQQDFAAIADAELSAREKAQLLTYGFAYLSRGARSVADLLDHASEKLFDGRPDRPQLALASRRRIDSISATSVIDELTRDLLDARPGDAFFAHLIIPHDPYAFRADCSVKPISEWLVRLSPEATRKETEQAYFDQIICLNKKLEGVFRALQSSGWGKDSIIIVHGDHGYRDAWPEPTMENIGHFSDADLVRGHSTLFAIRSPYILSGYDARRLPISALLAALAASNFHEHDVDLPSDFKASVVLDDQNWRAVKRYPLPAWWVKGDRAIAHPSQ